MVFKLVIVRFYFPDVLYFDPSYMKERLVWLHWEWGGPECCGCGIFLGCSHTAPLLPASLSHELLNMWSILRNNEHILPLILQEDTEA